MDLPGHEGEISIPITSTYASAHLHGHTTLHDTPRPLSNGSFPTPTTPATAEDWPPQEAACNNKKGELVVYRECLKNHAASIGGRALDGCGEFMPSGKKGTLEALRCSACSCHRNFHRKEIGNHQQQELKKVAGQKSVLISTTDAYGYNPASSSLILRPSPHHMIMPLGALQSSEWLEEVEGAGGGLPRASMVKKRVRTKFTPEQKGKMLDFAEKVGWRLPKEDAVVQQLCQEIGVTRRVLKVWMHNNKHNLGKKSPLQVE